MIHVYNAREAHIPDILKIERSAFAVPWTEGTLIGMLYREDVCFAVASGGAGALGFVILQAGGGESELYQIASRPDARRNGVASLLLDRAVDFARARTSERIFLEVRENNRAARNFYEKHGFAAVGRRRNYYADPIEDAVIMSKKLTANEETP